MGNYSMVGNGTFGGHNNFLGHVAGVVNNAVDGLHAGMNFSTTLMNYQNMLATNPSAVQRQIAQNIQAQGTAEGEHYRNYMMNGMLSRLAGGQPLLEEQKRLLNSGFIQGFGPNNANSGMTGAVQGTPVATQTNAMPATQVAQPMQPSVQPLPPTQYKPQFNFQSQALQQLNNLSGVNVGR